MWNGGLEAEGIMGRDVNRPYWKEECSGTHEELPTEEAVDGGDGLLCCQNVVA